MEKINRYVIFDTATGSFNMGDYIIYESAIKHLKDFINDGFVLDISTHTPIAHFYQQRKGTFRTKYYDEAKYKFLLGTNILRTNMLHLNPDWNVNIFNCKYYKNTILVGCGLAGKKENVNWYSKMLYKKILRKDIIHSVRDDETKKFLESIGFKAINTGCPTLWDLDDETCNKIEQNKADSVVFTLTDYCRNKVQDQKLIDILQKNYKKIYFWIQGSDDMEYLQTFKNISNIKYINPRLENYDKFLQENKVDYVGTRLHAGIKAMQHYRRTIIIVVDNRARDMKETYNLVTIERDEIEKIDELINSKFETKLNLNKEKITQWKEQFK